MQVVLDKGEREDWFSSSLYSVVSDHVDGLHYHGDFLGISSPHPVIDIRLFKNRNFAISCVMMFMLGAALFGATVLLPQLVQTLMGYTAQQAGLVLSPGAIVIILMLPFVGKMISKVDPRWMIAFGFGIAGIGVAPHDQRKPGHGHEDHRDDARLPDDRAWRSCSCRSRR